MWFNCKYINVLKEGERMADSQIKWRQGDFIRLGQAVSRFNKK